MHLILVLFMCAVTALVLYRIVSSPSRPYAREDYDLNANFGGRADAFCAGPSAD